MVIQDNVSLRGFNTFGIDARAKRYVRVSTEEELHSVLSDPALRSDLRLVLGGGSNILFTHDVDGLVIQNDIAGISTLESDDGHVLVTAGAGVVWHTLVMFCVDHGLGGIENMSLIPGRVGAAPMQNIGAYGVELKDVFHSLRAMRIDDGTVCTFSADECRFGYRESVFKRELAGQFIITSVTLRLSRSARINTSYGAIATELADMGISSPTIADVSRAVIRIRQSKLPDPAMLGNAGSFFKNPVVSHEKFEELRSRFPDMPSYPAPDGVKLAAGWLIEQCGWKGKRVGSTGCHAQQALVIVNYGGATGHEIHQHSLNVVLSVTDRFGVELEREVNLF
jgi:UDP-N-acetylmuramate dehydrogenase